MKKIIIILLLGAALYGITEKKKTPPVQTVESVVIASNRLTEVYEQQLSNVQVRGEGVVVQKLRDDLKGSRHQRFILKLASGQTLLVAHNIDISQPIKSLQKGDVVEFYGEYEWNNKGGVVHWTHHDPGGRHANGWLKHNEITYQ